MSGVTVTVRLFAMLRERAGRDAFELELAEGATVADALEALRDRDGLGEMLGRMPVLAAVNREYAAGETPLATGDELALIPPVSGGETGPRLDSEPHVRISPEPLSLDSVAGAVVRPDAGAVVAFEGTTREVDRLEYEGYVEMAERRIEAMLRERTQAPLLDGQRPFHSRLAMAGHAAEEGVRTGLQVDCRGRGPG
jgi:molybdopterin synthase catalytic subunit